MRTLKVLLGLAVTLASICAAHAGPFVQYNLAGGAQAEATTVYGSDWVHASGPAGPAGTATVDGRGTVGAATIGLAGSGSFDGSWAWAGWTDSISVSPALIGQTMRIWFTLSWDWSVSVVGDGNASVYVDVYMRPSGSTAWSYASVGENVSQSCAHAGACGEVFATNQNGGYVAGPYGDGWASFMFEIQGGLPHSLAVGVNAVVTGADGAAVSVNAATVRWGGVYLVTSDHNTNTFPDFSIWSSSGFDYSQAAPVPEVPTLMLWVAGLAGVAWRRRTQR
jgi:hypothetical protein